jgi:DNA-binding MarR family transcriptional regulator
MTADRTQQNSDGVADAELDDLVDEVLFVSRALFGLSVRSLATISPGITLLHYRTLVVLASRGPQRLSALRSELGTQAPAVTRLCNRLVERGLAERRPAGEGGREIKMAITPQGAALIREVLAARRIELAHVVEGIPPKSRRSIQEALVLLGKATGEPRHMPWARA